jgi:hypothetical protein
MPGVMDEIDKLKERIGKLETYFKIALTVGVILGLGGSFIGTQLYSVANEVRVLQATTEAQTAEAKKQIANAGKAQMDALANFSKSDTFLSSVEHGFVKENAFYRLEFNNTGFFMDVARDAPSNGVNPQLWQGSLQVWRFVPAPN